MANKFNVNTDVVPLKMLNKAIDIEFEHKDIIGHDPEKAFKIAMAHLREYPDYYKRLIKLEAKADEYWRGKVKPNIYTNDATHSTKVGATRNETTTVKPKRAVSNRVELSQTRVRDVYGVRKGVRARRVQHFYPDYVPPKDTQRKTGQPQAKRYTGRRTTEDRGFQTDDAEPTEQ